MMRILIVDDHAVVRCGLRQIINEAAGACVFGEAGNWEEAAGQMEAQEWDLMLLDISLPGRSGIEILPDLKRLRPALPVLVLTMHPERQYAVHALKRGARGYITKDAPPEELLKAIRKIVRGEKYVSPGLAQELAAYITGEAGEFPRGLSRRERQVVSSLAAGATVTEAAAALSLSVKTISTYRARAFRKLGLHTDFDLARYAIEHGLAPPSQPRGGQSGA